MNGLNLLAQNQGCTVTGSGQTVCTGPYDERIFNPLLPSSLSGQTGQQYLSLIFPSIIGFIFVVGSIGFFFMVLLGGVQWIFSGGDKGAVENAKGRISNAVIGLVIMFAVYAIAGLIEAFFKVNVLTIDIGPLKI